MLGFKLGTIRKNHQPIPPPPDQIIQHVISHCITTFEKALFNLIIKSNLKAQSEFLI